METMGVLVVLLLGGVVGPGTVAAGREMLLERVYELSTGWRLVFGGIRVHADVV